MKTAVDTNVLIDVIGADPVFADSSEEALFAAVRAGAVTISEAVYAELTPTFVDADELQGFLGRTGIVFEPSSPDALISAGQAWGKYLLRSRNSMQCANCGALQSLACRRCGQRLRWLQHVIGDFLIGGHATIQADRLLTRDPRIFRTYFPSLTLA